MLVRRLLVAAGLVALVVTVVTLGGWPHPDRSLALLTGADVTSATASALVVLVCWVVIVVLVVAVAVNALPRSHRRRATPHTRSLAVLALGITILGLGIARHQGGYRVCCATPVTAERAQHLVH